MKKLTVKELSDRFKAAYLAALRAGTTDEDASEALLRTAIAARSVFGGPLALAERLRFEALKLEAFADAGENKRENATCH